jgi:TonB family protein
VRLHFSAVTLASLIFLVACATNPSPKNKASSGRRAAADAIGCLDTLRAADSISTIVKMTVAAQDPNVVLPRGFEDLFVEEFRSHFKLPARLPLSVVKGSEPCDSLGSRCVGGVLNVGAVAYATAHNDGKLTDIQVLDVAMTPHFADSVNSALQVIAREEMLPPMGEVESIPVVLQIGPEDAPDSVPAVRQVFKAQVPRYDWPFSYATMPAAGVDAKYPFTGRLAGVEDSVTLAFTVDSDGTIVTQSIELVSANYRDFVTSVLDALVRTRYHPAHLGDCAVATRMKQRFLFRLPE